jgi:hypothetical protein
VDAGASIEDLLALPPLVELPGLDFISTKPGFHGRNNIKRDCADLSFPAPQQAISVDELLSRGQAVQPDCNAQQCPKVPPTRPLLLWGTRRLLCVVCLCSTARACRKGSTQPSCGYAS